MVGGLINIVSYVSNDLYLTGSPQITFFKLVYRRHTNFAMESIFLDFDDDIKFNCETELVPPRIADLIHKAYLHIKIPSINITKNDVGIDTSDIEFMYSKHSAVSEFDEIKNVHMKIITDIYRIIYNAVNATNVTYSGLVQDVQEYVSNAGILDMLNKYNELLLRKKQELHKNNDSREFILDSSRSNVWNILTSIDPNRLFDNATKIIDTDKFEPNSDEYNEEIQRIMKDFVLKEVANAIEIATDVQNFFFEEHEKFIRDTSIDMSPNIRFAWVKNLGHSIIDNIEIHIGGKKIDRHLGIWINIWYQLTHDFAQIEIYNRLIGNVKELNNFDDQEKPSYDIYVPLSFWFNKFNGLSFPMIAMQYNDIRFNVKLRKFEEVFFIERIYRADVNGTEMILTAKLIDFLMNRSSDRENIKVENIERVMDISLQDIWDDKGKQLNGHIMMDYIYLDSSERKRFAQSGHEYLIERIQSETFHGVIQLAFDVQLDFTNPCKELVWAFLKDVYTENEHGSNPCKWTDHTTGIGNDSDDANPVETFAMTFNTYDRVQRQVGKYFDTYQPLFYHNVTPSRGINLYSFSLDPKQHQPTGSANLSRLNSVRFFMRLSRNLFRYTDEELYPYDIDINFPLTIPDNNAFIELIDTLDIANRIKELTDVDISALPINRQLLLKELQLIECIIEQIRNGETNKIELRLLRRLRFRTGARMHVFSLSMNILRLIGGYGSLAFSGNN